MSSNLCICHQEVSDFLFLSYGHDDVLSNVIIPTFGFWGCSLSLINRTFIHIISFWWNKLETLHWNVSIIRCTCFREKIFHDTIGSNLQTGQAVWPQVEEINLWKTMIMMIFSVVESSNGKMTTTSSCDTANFYTQMVPKLVKKNVWWPSSTPSLLEHTLIPAEVKAFRWCTKSPGEVLPHSGQVFLT